MVGRIFAVAGLSGAGKTTAVNFLAETSSGEVVYFGDTVLRVVRERGLAQTSESEQIVRIALREQHGPAYLVMKENERIRSLVLQDRPVFIDAIYVAEEYDYLTTLVPEAKLTLIGIQASFETRFERVRTRPVRPLTENQLRERDAVEMKRLNTGGVLDKASLRITNERSMDDFKNDLTNVLRSADC
jgi:dephospho-CoA kinase